MIALTIGAMALLAGCGSASHPTTSRQRTTPAAPHITRAMVQRGALLVLFKRVVGSDPLASQLTVDTNGLADATITYGGINGEREQAFRLSPDQLRRLKRLLQATHLRSTTCCSPRSYTYWVTEGGRSWRLQQGWVPINMRPLILSLDGLTNVHTVL